ncbi:MAG TPA: hypothetical protein VNC23_10805 [Lapillicoccus sp.]|jgi:hypothetical protein|nr:hypothetical protein [Lapillicoccus sp.]
MLSASDRRGLASPRSKARREHRHPHLGGQGRPGVADAPLPQGGAARGGQGARFRLRGGRRQPVAAAGRAALFGWIGDLFALDIPATSELTQQRLGWTPTHPGLLEDLDAGYYAGT